MVSLCGWIFERMEDAAGKNAGRLRKVLFKARRNLPDVLNYLKRGEEALKAYAQEHGYPPEAFVLMYKMSGYSSVSPEYRAADKRVRQLLKKAYGNCYLKVQEILNGIKRASSLVENLNGRLRPHMNLKRMVPKKIFNAVESILQYKKIPEVTESGKGRKKSAGAADRAEA